MADRVTVPKYQDLLWPTVQALRELGGSGSIAEIEQTVAAIEKFTDAQQSVLHGDGPKSEIAYRIDWARTYLKGMGLATNSQRGVWSLTEAGRGVTQKEIEPLRKKFIEETRKTRESRRAKRTGGAEMDSREGESNWREELLSILLAMTPDAFERLCRRLLREASFSSVTVTGQTGDGGIDGTGVYKMSLVSFPVFFQAKRWKGSVGASRVRDFRGAMQGRGDKGLLITTGTFTTDAEREATRDGAPPVDLIDGETLCDLLAEYGIGVERTVRPVEYDYKINATEFENM